jgi:hypothetical protein
MKKKKRINTFKNWLLARDSSSRISTKSNYTSFLENSSSSEIDPYFAMSIFDKITDSGEIYKFQNNFIDLGVWKITTKGENKRMQFSFNKKYTTYEFQKFIKLLGINNYILPDQITVELDPNLTEIIKGPEEKKTESSFKHFYFSMKPTDNTKDIKYICQYLVKNIVELIDIKEEYKKDIFRYWVKKSVLEGTRYDNFPQVFESAFVDWMKEAKMEDRTRAYYEVLSNIKQGDSSIINLINSEIKEFGIEIKDKEDIDLGSNIIKRFNL